MMVIFYSVGTIVFFKEFPNQDTVLTNIWMFFYLFGTVFLFFVLISDELPKKKKEEKIEE